jgi:GT2 family glycosyltransferase
MFKKLLEGFVRKAKPYLPFRCKRFLKRTVLKLSKTQNSSLLKHGLVDEKKLARQDYLNIIYTTCANVLIVIVDQVSAEQLSVHCASLSTWSEKGWRVFVLANSQEVAGYRIDDCVNESCYFGSINLQQETPLKLFCDDFSILCPLLLNGSQGKVDAVAGVLALDEKISALNEFEKIIGHYCPKVSVVLLSYEGLHLIQDCLYSIEKIGCYPNLDLIIVDNGSSQPVKEFLRSYKARFPKIKLILHPENTGFAKGTNLGLAQAEGEYIILLNNDTFVTRGWIQVMLAHFRQSPKLGLLGPVTNSIANEAKIKIHYKDMLDMQEKAFVYTQGHQELLSTKMLAFFCTMMPKAVLDECGLLSEEYSLGMFEDDDYCKRALKAGYEIAIAKDVFVHHYESASMSKNKWKVQEDLLERNLQVFEGRWGPWEDHFKSRNK